MDPTENSSVAPNRRRLVVIGIGVGVLAAGVLFALASRDDDSTSSPGPTAIDSPAFVTGITPAGTATPDIVIESSDIPAASPAVPQLSSDIPSLGEFSRALVEPGTFTCTNTGLWQPYDELQLIVEVGEPAIGEVCADDIVPLPPGYCSSSPCSEVPPAWSVRAQPGTPEAVLVLVVAPDSSETGWFFCYRDLIPQGPQYLPLATTIEAACPLVTSDSVDIPYVPPATSDIPFVPPSASSDIPGG